MNKKEKLLILCLSFILFYRCSKKVDPLPSPVQSSIVGHWIASAYSIEGRTQSVNIEDVWFYDFTSDSGLFEFGMVFDEDPKSFSLEGYYYLDNTIVTDEGQVYMYSTFNTFNNQGHWSMEGNVVTLIEDDIVKIASIAELSDHTLILVIHTAVSETDEETLTTLRTNKTEIFTFVR